MAVAPDNDRRKRRLLIANDSPAMSAVIGAIVATEPNLSVVATATDGKEAVRLVQRLRPDLVLMDIHMPVMSGVEAIRRIVESGSRTRVLVTSATINRNLPLIFDALKVGAVDFVRSPALPYSPGTPVARDALRAAGAKLLNKIRTVLTILDGRGASAIQDAAATPCAAAIEPAFSAERESSAPDAAGGRLVAIGCSTGGPTTLAVLLSALPRPLPAPVLICQHIEPDFTAGFVEWLARETRIPVELTRDRSEPQPDRVYVAPGGQYNLAVSASSRLLLETAAPGQIYVPNIDHLFRTIAEQFEDRACGLILTGMGDDGARGLRAIRERGGAAFVQDEQSAIIPSMPRSALRIAGLERGYPLATLARLLTEWMNQ